ncbi:MAG TPA: substrate-binding domain-containing protein [Thermoanaerobaculia bacterium]|nr:substrate-binding domain-containing protein [Thermoanaerobaculia bacterium]
MALALLLAAGLLVGASEPSVAAEPFQIVVHSSNPVSALSAQEVSKMFMKKISRWQNGKRVVPVDLEERSPVRESFSQNIHGKGTAAIKAYWQRMIFSGREVPPPEKDTTEGVLDYVREHDGAIGYVPAGTPLGDGVKSVRLSP